MSEQAISSLELINYELTKTEVSEDKTLGQVSTASKDNILKQASTASEWVLEEITIVQGAANKKESIFHGQGFLKCLCTHKCYNN
ncbi:unnamed protein product [Macrosiphum euphorbiae]|uniref:Uncharacterized protein n=1 Tax=Macrosiphum euphorbiae TaxID=13131 RepID=A0AAV0WEM2_9HEMI|nr:unnamed protein product [Macrosiphum euphorbiae]